MSDEGQRNGFDGFDVSGNIIAGRAVAPGGRLHEHPIFIPDHNRNAVNLRL